MGEYLLCGFLGMMSLLNTAVRTQETVAVLWANLFQLCKAGLFAVGMSLLYLVCLRALKEGMEWLRRLRPVGDGLTFWRAYAVMAAAWLPQIIARYPGVLMWDTYMQIKQFMGEAERWANHPPFGTLLYGSLAWLGETVGNRNLVYCLFTIAQCASFLAVLSYSLCVMKRQGVHRNIRLGILALYAVSPCYAGWATVICKDTGYQIMVVLLAVELLVFVNERERFVKSWLHPAAVGAAFLGMMLQRHNGAPLAALVLIVLGIMLLKNRRALMRLLVCGAAAFLLFAGMEAAIVRGLNIQKRYIQDVLSLPLQQTARVVLHHDAEIPQDEKAIIDRVVDYAGMAENYDDDYADAVKDTYRQTATSADRMAYWKVWLRQMIRYPVEYADAMLHMNGVLFDLNDASPMYVCFSDMALHDYVYPYSFNDMSMYDREKLIGLDSVQRAVTEWYMDFDKVPLLGLMGSMSGNVILMLMLCYLCWVEKRRAAFVAWLPGFFTFGMCLFAPVVYLRYALPLIGTLPVAVGCMYALTVEKSRKEAV